MKKPKQSLKQQDSEAFRRLATTYYRPAGTALALPTAEVEEALPKKHQFKWRYVFLPFLLIVVVPLLIISVWNLRNFADASGKLFGTSNVLGVLNTKPLASDNGRVNILLVGYSADDPGHGGAELTDSILVMSLDQDNPEKSYMLSVPRDLYVDIQDYGHAKINEAYQAGERQAFTEPGYPNGGMGLLRKTVEESLGVELHYHALINYAAVREIVDALGGVTVDIQSPDPRGLYDPNFQEHEGGPLQLANGEQTVDGETALKLTRARGATYGSYGFPQSDFNRTQNQQMVVAAIIERLDWKLVLDPRTNGKIFNAIATNVRTDVGLSGVIPLYRLLMRTPTAELTSYTLRNLNDQNYLSSYTTPSGQSALIPAAGIDNYSLIHAAVSRLHN